jgi:2-polyprenyl-6-methoxyphenol hydroxylase-like FAD-dependent oxidoreductase
MPAEPFSIVGGGPAGASAALAITRDGGRPFICEKSAFPRHKLCGEFFSPEIMPLLEEIGLADGFRALGPACVTHAELNFSRDHRRFALPEPAWGLSRYVLDDFLLRAACERGARLHRECYSRAGRHVRTDQTAILTAGRSIVESKSHDRLFGFKAHFAGQTGRGPASDAVELFFFENGYAGACPIESGRTNVCGLAKESLLREAGFDPDRLIATVPRLAARLRPLDRVTQWRLAGPLRFGRAHGFDSSVLAAGDALCFVDPFTGSGVLAAMQTGVWAGKAAISAAAGSDWLRVCERYQRQCASFYRSQLATTGIVRKLLSLGWAETLAGLFPGWLLFRLTRPRAA